MNKSWQPLNSGQMKLIVQASEALKNNAQQDNIPTQYPHQEAFQSKLAKRTKIKCMNNAGF